MKRNNSGLITILLIGVIVALIFAVFFVNSLISKDVTKPTVGSVVKVKAASQTYIKIITISNNVNSPNTPSQTIPSPTTSSPTTSPIQNPVPSTTVIATSSGLISPTNIVTPTETVLSRNSSITPSTSINPSQSITPPTALPKTGYMTNLLLITALSSVIVFFSFLF